MPCESLLVEVDDKLRTFYSRQFRWNQHRLCAVLPLDEEGQFTFDVSSADDLFRFESAVERILLLLAQIISRGLFARLLWFCLRLLLWRVFLLSLLLDLLGCCCCGRRWLVSRAVANAALLCWDLFLLKNNVNNDFREQFQTSETHVRRIGFLGFLLLLLLLDALFEEFH